MKILIVRLSSIGDCVLASPVVEALLDRYPGAQVTWAVQSKSASVVRGLPGLHETLLWNDKRSPWLPLLRALWRTRRAGFDVVLDLQGLDKAGLFMLASGAKRRISGEGARRIAHWSSTERVPDEARNSTLHARMFYLKRAAQLDIAPDAEQRFFPRVPVTAAHRRFADNFLAQAGFTASHRVVGLNLGAAHEAKRWPAERFALLAHALLKSDEQTRIVVFGAAGDQPLLERFENELARCCSPSQSNATENGTVAQNEANAESELAANGAQTDNSIRSNSNGAQPDSANDGALANGAALANDVLKTNGAVKTHAFALKSYAVSARKPEKNNVGRDAMPGGAWRGRIAIAVGRVDLLQLAAIAERCAAFVSADTGPMHVVAAVGAPLVALFGPTDATRTGPVQKPDGAPIRVLDARVLTGLPRAPMTALEVADVLREVQLLMAQTDAPLLQTAQTV